MNFKNAYDKALSDSSSNANVVNYIKEMYPAIVSEIESWNLKQEIQNKVLEAFDGADTKEQIEKSLHEFEKGGGVKLTVRPVIDDSLLEKAGWGEQPGGQATVYTSTYSDETETRAINFTPIITDGKGNFQGVMTPEELQRYAENVISGVHGDYLNLQIGAEFNGEDAIQQAEEAAQKIHELHEKYFLDNTSGTEFSSNELVNNLANQLKGLSVSDLTTNFGQLDEKTQIAFNHLRRYFGLNQDEANVLIELLVKLGIVVDDVKDSVDSGATFNLQGFSESMSEIQKLQTVYSNWKKKVESDPTKIAIDISEVEGLREKFASVVGNETFDNFVIDVGTASSVESVNNAFQQLVQTYIQSSGMLDNINSKSAQLVQTQLESIGVTNAEYVVKQKLNQAQEELSEKTKELHIAEAEAAVQTALATGASYEAAAAKLTEMAATEQTRLAVFKLIAAEEIFNNADLSVEGKISQLESLASAFLTTANAAALAGKAEGIKDRYQNGAYGSDAAAAAAAAEAELAAAANSAAMFDASIVDVTVDLGKFTDAAKGAGSGAGKAADGANEAKDAISELNSEIDALQDNYSKLKKIQESYNKSGKISIDQAQELSQMDFRYLATLKLEGNQLKINEGQYKSLAQAKMAELKIAMMRRAIDLANSLKTEADAVAWLNQQNATLALTDAAVTEAEYAKAMAMLTAAGGARAEAAAMIQLALANAMAMMENVDYSTLVADAGEAGGDMGEAMGDEMGEEFEEEIDWIERRLETLDMELDILKAKYDNISVTGKKKIYDQTTLNQLEEYKKELKRQKKELKDLGFSVNDVVFGNINTDKRNGIKWTVKNLKKYKQELMSWYKGMTWDEIQKELKGSTSTVFGASGEYGGVKIAFSPILQTDEGAEILNKKTVDKYIKKIMKQAGGDVSKTKLLELDRKGIEVDGKKIKGLIADIGENAEKTAQAMHFTGATGAIKTLEKEISSLNSQYKMMLKRNANLDQQLDLLWQKHDTNRASIKKYQEKFNEAVEGLDEATIEKIKHGAIEIETITDEATSEAIKRGEEFYDKIQKARAEMEKIKTEMAEIAKQKFDNILEAFKITIDRKQFNVDLIDLYKSISEAKGEIMSEHYFKKQNDVLAEQYEVLKEQYEKGLAALAENTGFNKMGKNSEKYFEAVADLEEIRQKLLEIEAQQAENLAQIYEAKEALEDLKHTVQSIQTTELEDIYELLGDEDKFINDKGKYSDKGYTALGVLAERYTAATADVQNYRKELEELLASKETYIAANGVEKYYNRLETLQQGMYDAAKSAEELKNQMVELRIKGLEKQKDLMALERSGLSKIIISFAKKIKTR